jgi:hypothetical protein
VEISSLQIADQGNLPSEFVDLAAANGRCWVLTAQGLYEYGMASGTLSGLLVSGSYYSLAIDQTRNQLALGADLGLDIVTATGAQVGQIALPAGQVRRLVAIYNK